MYTSYWGLQEKPFENTPDPKFLYRSRYHNEALARLLYVVHEKKGALLLTGEVGSGKTLLSRILWHELNQHTNFQPVYILNPRLNALEFVQEICSQMGNTAPASGKLELFHYLHKMLFANNSAGIHTIILIDEAQAINDRELYEELRLLLNFQLDNSFLLTLVLMGQPELKYSIMALPQFNQRIAVRYHLQPLNAQETKEYIRYRLGVAGCTRELFSEEALGAIFECSRGVPRCVNNICDLALLAGSGNNLPEINKQVIIDVGKDLGMLPMAPSEMKGLDDFDFDDSIQET